MDKISDATLMRCITVLCSKDSCKFKENTEYYNLCHNRRTLLHYREFAGGRIYLGDCNLCNCEDACKIILSEEEQQ